MPGSESEKEDHNVCVFLCLVGWLLCFIFVLVLF